ncbi:MAG: PucR family transcriptional regulator ligand-binding domain-containing protein [Bacillota bacterium]
MGKESARVPGYVTVQEALEFDALRGVRVLAGRTRLDNRITGVNIMEVPEVTRWLQGGELLFTAFYAVKDSPEAACSLVHQLAEKGVAALAVKPGQYVPEIPAAVITAAESAGLPVLELPADAPYMDVARPILEAIMSRSVTGTGALETLQQDLVELVVAGSGLEPVLAFLARALSQPVLVFGPELNVLTSAARPDDDSQGWELELSRVTAALAGWSPPARRTELAYHHGPHPRRLSLFPIKASDRIFGYLGVLALEPGHSPPGSALVELAARILTLEFIKDRTGLDTGSRLEAALLEELMLGRPQLRELTHQKARILGLDLREPYTVVVFRLRGPHGPSEGEILQEGLYRATRTALGEKARLVLARADAGHLAGAVNCRPGHEASRLLASWSRVLEELAGRLSRLQINAGVSRVTTGLDAFRKAYDEALQAAEMYGSVVYTRVTTYARLGVYRLLNELAGSPALLDFYKDTVSVLVEHDAKHQSDLCHTAETFFACGRNLQRAAELLHIHRNTLAYRLGRVEEITGYNLKDPESCFELHLALKVRHLAACNGAKTQL